MIDPLLSLAFSMHTNKGVFALLLGSGISRAAEIPTGWEVVLDLIAKLAHLEGEDCHPSPEAWYRAKYKTEPDYALLLASISDSQSERSQLLKRYFEPSEEEQERSVKIPTEAHHAIAQLVVKGYIRVILTTNFDRLIEKALEAAGITPIVISSVDGIKGALPLVHASCTVIKLHGDYLDTRILNTPDELSRYEASQNALLDKVFDEYGLIVCGWSGEWDTALKVAIQRCSVRRFSTYWTHIQEPSSSAEDLIAKRGALKISISGADNFFTTLLDKINSLEELDRPHPLSAKLAISTVKRFIVDDKYRIRLADLVHDETEALYESLTDDAFGALHPYSFDALFSRLEKYESLVEILMAILVTVAYWGDEKQVALLVKSLQRVCNAEIQGSGTVRVLNASFYPGLLLHYATGLSCLASDSKLSLGQFFEVKRKMRSRHPTPICSIDPGQVVSQGELNAHLGRSLCVPTNERICDLLRFPLKPYIPDDDVYESLFDRFEYLRALIALEREKGLPIIGCFGWRNRNQDNHISALVDTELLAQGHDWILLKLGYFNNDMSRLKEVKAALDRYVDELGWG